MPFDNDRTHPLESLQLPCPKVLTLLGKGGQEPDSTKGLAFELEVRLEEDHPNVFAAIDRLINPQFADAQSLEPLDPVPIEISVRRLIAVWPKHQIERMQA
jgi:hypothetical protein